MKCAQSQRIRELEAQMARKKQDYWSLKSLLKQLNAS